MTFTPVVGLFMKTLEIRRGLGSCGTVFFSMAFLLSTVFADVWRPLLIVVCVSTVLALAEGVFQDAAPIGIFRVMSAETFFRGGGLPWIGLAAAAAASSALLYAATRNIARQDF